MIEYVDGDNEKLERGLYIFGDFNNLVYFTGKYSEESGFPIFEKENEIGKEREFPVFVVKRLYKIAKKEARERLDELKKRTNWLERRIEE